MQLIAKEFQRYGGKLQLDESEDNLPTAPSKVFKIGRNQERKIT